MRRLVTSVSLGVLCLFAGVAGPAAAQNSTVSVRLVDSLSTGSTQRGDTFNATLTSPLIWHNRVVAGQGARVIGRVTQVVSAGWFKRPAVITLSLGTTQGRSGSIPVQTGDLTIKGVTKPVSLNVVKYGEFNDPAMGHRIAFAAETKINRQDYGMKFDAVLDGKFVVSHDIQINIEGELLEAQEPAKVAS